MEIRGQNLCKAVPYTVPYIHNIITVLCNSYAMHADNRKRSSDQSKHSKDSLRHWHVRLSNEMNVSNEINGPVKHVSAGDQSTLCQL